LFEQADPRGSFGGADARSHNFQLLRDGEPSGNQGAKNRDAIFMGDFPRWTDIRGYCGP
jgi:hypothetical protein